MPPRLRRANPVAVGRLLYARPTTKTASLPASTAGARRLTHAVTAATTQSADSAVAPSPIHCRQVVSIIYPIHQCHHSHPASQPPPHSLIPVTVSSKALSPSGQGHSLVVANLPFHWKRRCRFKLIRQVT
uniref:Uncharacterized protein n=1 Tax=Oryza rufipogon TaxID=4529 RepID=A0A0E0NXY2_ORYRU